jgi:phage minor structural protein
MLTIYNATETDFNNNGLGFLEDFTINPKIIEELNGELSLSFEYSIDGVNSQYLIENNIIRANYDGSFQLFKIKKAPKNLKRITIYALHIFYNLANNFLEDVRPENMNGASALDHILRNTQYENSFIAFSDIDNINTAYYVEKNPVQAIISEDNSLCNLWGGELERDNFTVKLLSRRGADNGVKISYGKNMKQFEEAYDDSNFATRIFPKGSNNLKLPEKYIDSPLIDNYPQIVIKPITFDDVTIDENTTEEQALNMLRSKVQELYSAGIDVPKLNVKVDWQDLSKTEEYYSKYNVFETVRLGDTITVETHNTTLTTRVIKIIYDCILEKYTNFELGNFKPSFFDNQLQIVKEQIQVNNTSMLNSAKAEATSLINSANGGYATKTQSEFMILDTGNPATAQQVSRWNINGLGYSSNGINGVYDTAITKDGKLVLDRATVGQLDGIYIKGGSITSDKIDTTVFKNGGTNLIKNSVGSYDYGWTNIHKSYTSTEIKNNTVSQNCFFISNKASKQIIRVQNGTYTISWKYKKLLELANAKLKINGNEIVLDSLEWTTDNYTFEVKSNIIEVEIIGDNDDCCYLSDLMCNLGYISQTWSSANGESSNGGVSISDKIVITASAAKVRHVMDNDSDRYENTETNAVVGQWTSEGLDTNSITANKATIAGCLIQKHMINNKKHVFFS